MSLAIEAFVDNTRRYCDWIESDRHDVASVRQLLLALLQGVPYLITSGTDDCEPQRGKNLRRLGGGLEAGEEGEEGGFELGGEADLQGALALGAGVAAGAVDEVAAEGVEAFKNP